MKKLTFILMLMLLVKANAQEGQRVISTGVPFLSIAADARASGMGDVGVATSTDAFSQQWNPAKFAFAERKMGIGMAYTPYLEAIVTDISLLNASFYNKISENSAFAISLRYFGLGDVELRQFASDPGITVKPNEFALDGSYSLKLSPTFSMAVAGRFINSNLRLPVNNFVDSNSGSTFAVDVAGFYRSREIAYNNFDGRWRAGFNISNIGGKIQYEDGGQDNFLPSNLKLGAGFDFILDQDNVIGITSEFNKLLIPTPQDENGDGVIDSADKDIYQNRSGFSGIFSSFGDAPDGFSEELKEITWALGAEYVYQDSFMVRTGYFNESEEKGSRKFFTLGAGFKFKSAQIDLSYLFSTAQVRNPIENTLRFGLTFSLGEEFYND
ncbi:type IX secretion system outer membrane channel protein PorV [Maribacter aurantiacus]|uniref:Type IX secretion system outer membrane channel protein PorV n=1 Tax=Maribacter aurantiacus TaxID=1882343 RepID=A0A5R8LUQ0_9FLAO|nr:type IX secretion system outer membrane channel protein PorV [Maribacter aurantiacus]TLF40956.1 type IX secretion system outer membrane channel protein PorV [Maribacter aurantiacus]